MHALQAAFDVVLSELLVYLPRRLVHVIPNKLNSVRINTAGHCRGLEKFTAFIHPLFRVCLARIYSLQHTAKNRNGRAGISGQQQIGKAGRVSKGQNIWNACMHTHSFILGATKAPPIRHVNFD